jgi:hypothetical protein
MNTRNLLVGALGLTAMLGGLSSAYADTPVRMTAPATHATAKAPEARMVKAKAGARRLAERRLARHERRMAARRAVHAAKFAQAKAARKEAKAAHRVG